MPDHIKEKAREMAREELARRLEELNMSAREAKGYSSLLAAVDSHIARLHDLLESEYLIFTRTMIVNNSQCIRSLCQRRGTGLGETSNRRRTR